MGALLGIILVFKHPHLQYIANLSRLNDIAIISPTPLSSYCVYTSCFYATSPQRSPLALLKKRDFDFGSPLSKGVRGDRFRVASTSSTCVYTVALIEGGDRVKLR